MAPVLILWSAHLHVQWRWAQAMEAALVGLLIVLVGYSVFRGKVRSLSTVSAGISMCPAVGVDGLPLSKGIVQKCVFSKHNYPSVVELNGTAAHHESQSSS